MKPQTLQDPQHYSVVMIVFHWLSVVLVVGLFLSGFYMVGLDYYDPWYNRLPEWHKSWGVIFLILTVVRLLWRILGRLPEKISAMREWESLLASWMHRWLYLLLMVVVLSGYLITGGDGSTVVVFGLLELPSLKGLAAHEIDLVGEIHEWSAYILILFVVLHSLAALKHHFINRDASLIRILKPSRGDVEK